MPDQCTRRDFLRTSSAIAAGAGMGLAALAPPCAAAADAARTEPVALPAHRRRLIYNNDGNEPWFPGTGTREGFLANRLQHVLGTQVDTVFYCTGATTMFTHLAKVGETYGEFCPDWFGGGQHPQEHLRT